MTESRTGFARSRRACLALVPDLVAAVPSAHDDAGDAGSGETDWRVVLGDAGIARERGEWRPVHDRNTVVPAESD